MPEVIWSSAEPIDTSWRDSFKRTPGLRERAAVEFRRVHEIEHARANTMFRCPICHGLVSLSVNT